MTFTEILAAVYEETGYQTTPSSAVVTRIKRYVNEGVRAILAEPGLARLIDSDGTYTFASVASQVRYAAPEAVSQIRHVTERSNQRMLGVMGLAEYRAQSPDPVTTTGTPTFIVPFGRTAVNIQPSDASELFVKSTSASDTGTAYLEGIITGGYSRTASVTMTGLTAVSLSAAITTFIDVTDFYLSANAVGTVTLHEDSGSGTELARITIGAKRPRYYGFYLWPTPDASLTYQIDYRRDLADMVQDTDEPPIAVDAHPACVAYAAMREWEQKGDTDRLIIAKQRYDKALSRLKYTTQTLGDEIPISTPGRLAGLIGRRGRGGLWAAGYGDTYGGGGAGGAITATSGVFSSTLQVTGNVTFSGTANSVGTITSGVWNAGAITSSGAITSAVSVALTGATNNLGTITTGIWNATKIGLAYGGTNADLSATGGTSKFLKQATTGAAITVVQPAVADLSDAANVALLNAANTFTGGTQAISSATGRLNITSTTGVNAAFETFVNTGGSAYIGIENSTGNAIFTTGGSAYSFAILAPGTTYSLELGTNNKAWVQLEHTTGYLKLINAGTAVHAMRVTNTGGDVFFGVERSTGGGLATGTSAYAAVAGSIANQPFELITNDVVRQRISAAGAVTFTAHVAGTATWVTGDKYLVVDASGNVHVSAVGPAS